LPRLWKLVQSAAVPLALQGLYVIALRGASGLGTGNQTSLTYAYLIAATLVATTASSLSLISSAPLTRRGIDAESASAHVVHAAWLSLTVIAAAAGVFALVGGRVVGAVLGGAYTGEVGTDLGRLVVYPAPWVAGARRRRDACGADRARALRRGLRSPTPPRCRRRMAVRARLAPLTCPSLRVRSRSGARFARDWLAALGALPRCVVVCGTASPRR